MSRMENTPSEAVASNLEANSTCSILLPATVAPHNPFPTSREDTSSSAGERRTGNEGAPRELAPKTLDFMERLRQELARAPDLNYGCDSCEKSFKSKRGLSIHKNVHNKKKKWDEIEKLKSDLNDLTQKHSRQNKVIEDLLKLVSPSQTTAVADLPRSDVTTSSTHLFSISTPIIDQVLGNLDQSNMSFPTQEDVTATPTAETDEERVAIEFEARRPRQNQGSQTFDDSSITHSNVEKIIVPPKESVNDKDGGVSDEPEARQTIALTSDDVSISVGSAITKLEEDPTDIETGPELSSLELLEGKFLFIDEEPLPAVAQPNLSHNSCPEQAETQKQTEQNMSINYRGIQSDSGAEAEELTSSSALQQVEGQNSNLPDDDDIVFLKSVQQESDYFANLKRKRPKKFRLS